MNKRKKTLLATLGIVSVSIMAMTSISYAAYTKSITIEDPNITSPTDLSVIPDKAMESSEGNKDTVSVRFYCTAVTSYNYSLYLDYGTGREKMTYDHGINGSASEAIWRLDKTLTVGQEFGYHYLIAKTNNANDVISNERNSEELSRRITPNYSTFVQEDSWKIKCIFWINYDCGSGHYSWLLGNFNSWTINDDSKMTYHYEKIGGIEYRWKKELQFQYKASGSNTYEFKFWVDKDKSNNDVGYEPLANNRTVIISGLTTSGNICGEYNLRYRWGA